MPLAVTVFGISGPTSRPVFCYAFLRSVRGPGQYPAPTLSEKTPTNGIRHKPLKGYDLQLVTWDRTFDESGASAVRADLNNGHFNLAAACPIASGASLAGDPFGPILIAEASSRLRVSGSGILSLEGLALTDGVSLAIGGIEDVVGSSNVAAALKEVIGSIAEESGLDSFFMERQRIGVVDYFYRARSALDAPASLFDFTGDKPDLRTRNPVSRVRIRRKAPEPNKSFRLHVTLRNFDEISAQVLVDFSPSQLETFVEAAAHMTNLEVTVFGDDGDVVIMRTLSSFRDSVSVLPYKVVSMNYRLCFVAVPQWLRRLYQAGRDSRRALGNFRSFLANRTPH